MQSTIGKIEGGVEALQNGQDKQNGTLDIHAFDIQTLKTDAAITKASTVKFRWFLGVLIPIVAIAASAWFKLG